MFQSGTRYNSSSIPNGSIHQKGKKVPAFIIDETQIQIGYNSEAWLWVALEPIHGQLLGVYISRHRNMLVTELFLKSHNKIIW